MDFFTRVGPVAIGSRARLISDRLTNDSRQLISISGSDIKAKWFPLLYLLQLDGPLAVSELAESIGQSHPGIVRMVNEMVREGLARRSPDPNDGRRSLVQLTDRGRGVGEILSKGTVPDVAAAVAEIEAECEHDLWAAIAEWESALERRSLLERTLAIRRKRMGFEVSILPYASGHQRAWHDLNEAWISRHFTMEEADYRSLRDPQTYILNKGGAILVAEYRGEIVGTCALIPMTHPLYGFELAKMAVSPKVQGLGIGASLGRATLALARKLGAKRVYLESNRKLGAALRLYRRLGFVDVEGIPSPYARADVKMAVDLALLPAD